MTALRIEYKSVKELTPYAKNSRTHGIEQIAQIAASITEFGFTSPVLVDARGGIIAGHGRVLAAQKLKIKEVPCIKLEHLTEAQKRAYVIADNKIALGSGWDVGLLQSELLELSDTDIDFAELGLSDLLGSVVLEDDFQPKTRTKEQSIESDIEPDIEVERQPKPAMTVPLILNLSKTDKKAWAAYAKDFDSPEAAFLELLEQITC